MVPPKDPYIKVRVLEDIGNVVLSDHSANLARHAIVFLRRTDAELYIAQVTFLSKIFLSLSISSTNFTQVLIFQFYNKLQGSMEEITS